MDKNMLTTKELTLLADLLIYEELACKKAKVFSRTLLDVSLAQQMSAIADNHERRFNALLGLL